jgi:hypothetical protein
MFIDIFGDIFAEDFKQALELKPNTTPEEQSSKEYLKGIAIQSASDSPDIPEITRLFNFLNQSGNPSTHLRILMTYPKYHLEDKPN